MSLFPFKFKPDIKNLDNNKPLTKFGRNVDQILIHFYH